MPRVLRFKDFIADFVKTIKLKTLINTLVDGPEAHCFEYHFGIEL